MRTLSSASIGSHQLQLLYSELVTLKSRLGLELEALSRYMGIVCVCVCLSMCVFVCELVRVCAHMWPSLITW